MTNTKINSITETNDNAMKFNINVCNVEVKNHWLRQSAVYRRGDDRLNCNWICVRLSLWRMHAHGCATTWLLYLCFRCLQV